jgi:2,3-bisphosphoglycerate-independent phosphoglycerate mutase
VVNAVTKSGTNLLRGSGFLFRNQDEFNAIHRAHTPCMDALKAQAPARWRTIKAHGTAVGLPSDADMGNSEVGHNALGAGQVIDQGASLVDKALESGSLVAGDGWAYISEAFPAHTVHFIALLSDGGVHSRTDQLYGCLRAAQRAGAARLALEPLDLFHGPNLRGSGDAAGGKGRCQQVVEPA